MKGRRSVLPGVTGGEGGSLSDLVLSPVVVRRVADGCHRGVFHVTHAITAGDRGVIGRMARSTRSSSKRMPGVIWRMGPVTLEQGRGSYRRHKGSAIEEMQGASAVPGPAGRMLTGRQRPPEGSAHNCFT